MSKKECAEYCGRRAAKSSAAGYCCRGCAVGAGEHTTKCDERESKRED